MNNTSQKNRNKNKIFVIFVALIFLGSMAGAMLYSTGDTKKAADLPASKIVSGLSDDQKQRILFGSQENPADRYVLITLNVPKICDPECNGIKQLMGQVLSAYDPAIYLSEVQSESASNLGVSVRMESYLDKKELSEFNLTGVEDFICSNTIYRIDECVLRKMDFGASNENKTEIKEIKGTAGGENSSAINITASNASNSTGQGNVSDSAVSNITEQRNISNSTGTQ
ncbi:MAG: hypothetical protein ABIF85_06280 [Nanoarchaeota archaeon]|nr:hypothetical protein [Nanoarchaeota archaeon]MBU4300267.1 hypothetical protein [Nanoarchaeota archaeon]MCG2723224.1 hypothetical protein [archaeon]